MNNQSNDDRRDSYRAGSSYDKYSRSAGVGDYRRRRRQGRAFRIVSIVLLLAIIGSAAFVFSSRVLDMPRLWENMQAATEPEQSTEEAAAPTTTQPVEIKLLAAGDIIANGAVAESALANNTGGYSFDHLFSNIKSELINYDLRIVNQETNLPGSGYGYGSRIPLNADSELGNAEANAGFNVILRANDHVLDNGYDGLHNEFVWWHDTHPQIPLLGIAEPDPEQNPGFSDYVSRVYIFEKNGFRIAILNHTLDVGEDDLGVVSSLDEGKIADDIKKARDTGAQMIVACPHWGDENNTEPTEEERNLAQLYANNGVDVILGTHPRVLQPVEILQGPKGHKTVCFYSLGCLVSSLEQENLVGGLAELTLVKNEKGEYSVKNPTLKPVVTYRANGEDFTTYMLANYTPEVAERGWDYLMPDAVSQTCAEILGEGYNTETNELKL